MGSSGVISHRGSASARSQVRCARRQAVWGLFPAINLRDASAKTDHSRCAAPTKGGYNTEFHSGRVRGGRDLAVRTMQNRRGLSYDGLSSLAPIVTDCGASSALDALPHRPGVVKCTYAYCRFELPQHRARDVRFQASCSNSAQLPSRRGRDADSGARGGHRGRRRHRHRRWVASNHSVQCPLDTRKQHETYV